MAPKQNAKAVAARARKEEQESGKKAKAAQAKEAEEADKWSQGAKGKAAKESKAEAAEAARARKAERDRLLAEEEASQPAKVKAPPKAGAKKAAPPKAPSIPSFSTSDANDGGPSSFSASGIDDALDALSLATSRTDKAYVGAQAAKIETHPERRFKAAFEAYKEEQLPILKKEHPGLRLNQYQDKMYEAFKKSPQNPFNQAHLSHNATKDDKVAALQAQKADIARRLGN
ncbi:DUF1014-domain-containing protein [Rhodotorula diobovata]|uniref:DUF1014-domain-containing protein n=1 Tax=Rhodotorula diobovata TaxID=5288 RepID=A0A5C5FP02_9BASI|nr:DUF1014-domain-containing protein [Rhodotorula diobovata]